MAEPDKHYQKGHNQEGNFQEGDFQAGQPQEGQRPGRRPLDVLEATILARQAAPNKPLVEKSYTAKLLAGGVEKIGGKIIEEAAELVEAAGEPEESGRQHTIYEAGDLLYHTLVLLAARGVRLSEVEAELARRVGVSGLDEKASRGE